MFAPKKKKGKYLRLLGLNSINKKREVIIRAVTFKNKFPKFPFNHKI